MLDFNVSPIGNIGIVVIIVIKNINVSFFYENVKANQIRREIHNACWLNFI